MIMPNDPILCAEDLSFAYGTQSILRNSSFAIDRGEFLCLLGPSGCGKTTLLNLVAGFLQPTGGKLLLEGQPIKGPSPERAVVFQTGALFDWMTVRDNIVFSLICRGASLGERRTVGDEMAALVGLEAFQDRYPYELSGGMRQRVGVARVLAAHPKIMLMDEPFAAVDVQPSRDAWRLLQKIPYPRPTRCPLWVKS
jgi:ABC-type taurine transport system ATPase subunit